MSVNFIKVLTIFLLWEMLCALNAFVYAGLPGKREKKDAHKQLEKAISDYRKGDIDNSKILLLQSLKSDTTNITAYLLLSDISADKKDYGLQIFALEKIIKLDSVNYPVAYKLLANLLFNRGEYSVALLRYIKYSELNSSKDSLFIAGRIKSCQFANESVMKNKNFEIIHLDSTVNTSRNEYWPAISTNDSMLYFTRLIDDKQNYAFERLFVSERDINGWNEAAQLNFFADSEVNIGTMCISADEKLIFMTICGFQGGRGSCDIYYSKKINGEWDSPVNAGSIINGRSWDSQPSVSADNHYLYFASSRSGGFGGMDIWRSEFKEMADGTLFFQTPENLGPGVNSSMNDFSPYIHSDGITLYFASEGKYGFGGSDIYMSRLNDSVWSDAINFGYPINTRYNEDGIVISPAGTAAIFSSNREASINSSKDLFQFNIPEEFLPDKVGYIKGYVVDKASSRKLKANIEITQLETGDSKNVYADQIDGYMTTLVANKMYALNVNLKGFLFYSQHIDLKNVSTFQKAKKLNIYLEPIKAGDIITLSNIFFDFNSSTLQKESFPELNQIILFLEKNQDLKVEISGHTDNIGTEEYNLNLSEERAKSIYNYLVQRTKKERLSFKGYGATIPVASNEIEEGRAKNRRCELKIF